MSYTDLLKTVTGLGSPKILLVGDFMLDTYIYGDAVRISPEAPVQVLKVVKREYSCGGAASVAADVLALGAKCLCIGITGNDDDGQKLRSLLTERGADIDGLLAHQLRPTTCKQRIIGLAQHRHRQQLLRIDDEITEPLETQYYQKLIDAYQKKLNDADIVCLQDYNKGILEAGFCRELIRLAAKAGKKILIDPPPVSDYSKFKDASLITPNRKEAHLATGIVIDTIEAARKAAGRLRQTLNLEAAVITLDKDGAYLDTDSLSEHLPTQPRTVYDVTGAGDMTLAMLAVAIAGRCDYRTAVGLANIAAGLEVEKFGVATVSIDEIVNEIISSHKGKTGKIRDVDSLAEELKFRRRGGEKIVFTNGCFDVLHVGHIEYLKFCKSSGDVVVVGLNSDSSVRQIKGPDRPVNNQHERAAVLAELESVDYIAVFDEPDPLNIICKVRPDVLIKGADWAEKGVVGSDFVRSYGGKVVLAPMVEGKSSTATIEKLKQQKK